MDTQAELELHCLHLENDVICMIWVNLSSILQAQLEEEVLDFTKEQYAKAAKRLFRRLYTEQEYLGRSLTGTKANNQYSGRPGLEDLSWMTVIYGTVELYTGKLVFLQTTVAHVQATINHPKM